MRTEYSATVYAAPPFGSGLPSPVAIFSSFFVMVASTRPRSLLLLALT